jgi:hypothetical protein
MVDEKPPSLSYSRVTGKPENGGVGFKSTRTAQFMEVAALVDDALSAIRNNYVC